MLRKKRTWNGLLLTLLCITTLSLHGCLGSGLGVQQMQPQVQQMQIQKQTLPPRPELRTLRFFEAEGEKWMLMHEEDAKHLLLYIDVIERMAVEPG